MSPNQNLASVSDAPPTAHEATGIAYRGSCSERFDYAFILAS